MAFANAKFQTTTLFVFTIIFFIVFIDPYSVVQADLTSDVCSKTPQPGYCNQCLNSSQGIKKDTIRDLALGVIDCAMIQASEVHRLLAGYGQTAGVAAIAQCVSEYQGIQINLRQAATSWRDKQYGQAELLLGKVEASYQSCRNLLIEVKWSIPTDLTNAFYVFKAYDDVTLNILAQIK